MKQITRLLLIAILTLSFIACSKQTTGATTITPATTPGLFNNPKIDNFPAATVPGAGEQSNSVINVDDMAQEPDKFTGTVKVQGVVSSISESQHLMGIIDTREYVQCREVTCSSFILPVQWAGQMPRVEDTVLVTGQIEKSGGKYYFVAKLVENN